MSYSIKNYNKKINKSLTGYIHITNRLDILVKSNYSNKYKIDFNELKNRLIDYEVSL